MAARFPGSVPGAVWIVGRLKGKGSELSFPGRSENPLIQFAAEDQNEETLDLFDRDGIETWLQVEPGHAPVEELIHLMLQRYGHHSSVVGVGVDVEWYRSIDEPDGQAVTDAEATAWLAAARSHNPSYRLFLKHWLAEKMPPTVRDGIFFIDDSQILPSLDAMVEEFAAWGRAFSPAPVGFQIGYETDRPWWKKLHDPPAEIGRRILEKTPNTRAIYWVDFTVLEVFPPPAASRRAACSARRETATGRRQDLRAPAELRRALRRVARASASAPRSRRSVGRRRGRSAGWRRSRASTSSSSRRSSTTPRPWRATRTSTPSPPTVLRRATTGCSSYAPHVRSTARGGCAKSRIWCAGCGPRASRSTSFAISYSGRRSIPPLATATSPTPASAATVSRPSPPGPAYSSRSR